MKKVILITFLTLCNAIFACNLCWGYKGKDPRLKHRTITNKIHCDCNCWQYSHTAGNNNFYKCDMCGHRVTPPDPLDQTNYYKKYSNEKSKESKNFHPTMFTYSTE